MLSFEGVLFYFSFATYDSASPRIVVYSTLAKFHPVLAPFFCCFSRILESED